MYKKSVEIRWSDLDPNLHLRHSVYYDFGAYCRMCFFTDHGISTSILATHQIGPILFREECTFRREIHFGDSIEINVQLRKASRDYSRWTIGHEIIKNGNKVSALIIVDGAWLDTQHRKLAAPPPLIVSALDQIHKGEDFEWMEKK